jgi:hypothetical protein
MDEQEALALNTSISALQATTLNFSLRYTNDARVRTDYSRLTHRASTELRHQVLTGKLTAAEAAARANQMRNDIMAHSRKLTSPIGLAQAQKLKGTPKSLGDLSDLYAKQLYNKSFKQLASPHQNNVYLEVIEASGRTRASVNTKTAQYLKYGRALGVASAGIAAYNIYTADNKPKAIAREGVTIGGGALGGIAGGAAAGLICGPGAPICVTAGVLIGGALAAIGANSTFDKVLPRK